MKRVFTTLVMAMLVVALVPAAVLAQETGKVSVLHGIPGDGGFPVDVYVNDGLTLEDFTFETLAGPLDLPAGDYNIEVFAADADPASDTPALTADVTLPAGADATIVAHLDADGGPILTTFVNDVSNTDAGDGRVTVRHTAAAPTVDILAGGDVLFGEVPNGAEGVADVPAATYPVQVVPAGATEPVVFETDLGIPEGTNVIVYAIGDLAGETFTVAVQTISGLQTAPEGVPTGTAGLADQGIPAAIVLAGILGLLLAGFGTLSLARRES